MQPSNEHCSPSLPFPSPLLLSARAPSLFSFSLSFHLCHSYTDPLRSNLCARQGASTKSRSSTIWKIEQERKGEKRGEGRGGEGRGRTRIHTRVSFRFRFVPRAWLTFRGRAVPEIGARHEIEGSVASNMLDRINEVVVARRRLRK